MKNRDSFFDNAKFILIFLVVFGHLISPYRTDDEWLVSIYHFIFIFHMPAFILLAGHFSTNFRKRGYYVKIITRLLIPYLILQTLFTLYYNKLYADPSMTLEYFTPRWAMWFLLSMIAWKLLLPLFARFKAQYSIPIAILLGVGIGFIDIPERFLSLDRTFYFFPFFLIGYFLTRTNLFERLKDGAYRWYAAGFLVTVFVAIYILLGGIDGASILYGTYTFESAADMFLRIGIYGGSLLVTFAFFALVPKQKNIFTGIGRRSFYVYILHGFIIKWFFETVIGQTINSAEGYMFLLLLSIIVTVATGNKYVVKVIAAPFGFLKETLSIKNG
ncbi:Acyltransferase family protein [Bacillus sp. THAF10]|uniref:acyltransferase family protein n=1 Tax=Bacillus sp. THAF10 TaxID=2587848 RepID=UPI0012683BBA|nr:acyltransferase family protein [Bacillus sp. THAF10]QFT88596.1 Acyltransferase family protein [Bacillus sp. THAF10]